MKKTEFEYIMDTYFEMKNRCLCRYQVLYIDLFVFVEQGLDGNISVVVKDFKKKEERKYNLTIKLERV